MAAHKHLMNWQNLLSTKRIKVIDSKTKILPTSPDPAPSMRNEFHIDHDRIIFSNAFRRLGRKTQVHPLALNDHTHNRLTHSLEVACVGRSLGDRVGAMLQEGGFLPKYCPPTWLGNIVEVSCLAHDIGNPPFGHTGEEALRDWLRQPEQAYLLTPLSPNERTDILTFEGNAHSFRVVSSLEMYRYQGGMRLTAASLGALLKYPWTLDASPIKNKFSLYQLDAPIYHAIAEELHIPEIAPKRWLRHPLSYLMEAADDLCYAILDLEDAIELDLIRFEEFENIVAPLIEVGHIWNEQNIQQRCALLRGMSIGACVIEIADTFMRHHQSLLNGEFLAPELLSVCDPKISEMLNKAKDLARNKVYRYKEKIATEIAAYSCLSSLIQLLIPAVYHFYTHQKPSAKDLIILELLEYPLKPEYSLYQAYLEVLDFIGALTDNKAARLVKEISGAHF